MKRSIILASALLLLAALSCDRRQVEPMLPPERELSMPEKVEKEILDVLMRDWKSLSDTLDYFDSTMLSKGRLRGTAPDGVYYELKIGRMDGSCIETAFMVKDSVWASVSGKLIPLELSLKACGTQMAVMKEKKDTFSISVSNIRARVPILFFFDTEHQAPLLYQDEAVGYLTRTEFENPDYSTGTYLVVNYYDDPRTFSAYDNGLGALLKKNLSNVAM